MDSPRSPSPNVDPCQKESHPPLSEVSNNRSLKSIVSRRRFYTWISFCLVAFILSPIVVVIVGLYLHPRDFSFTDMGPPFPGRTVNLEAVLISADPKLGTLTLDWTIIGDNNTSCSQENLTACSDVQIFFDNNLLRLHSSSNSATVFNNRPTIPIFVFNATAFAISDIMANTATFRTQLALFSPDTPSSLIYYPFDRYTAEIFLFAQDRLTNDTVGVSLARTRGIAVGFKTSASTASGVTIPSGMIDIVVLLQRGSLVQTYCIIATIAIWLVTLILLLVMITSVFFGFRQKGEVLVIPVATLIAFNAVRSNMPGAPEGDILDFVGFLPCLALLTICAALTLGTYILTDPTHEDLPMTWDVIYQRASSTSIKLTT